MEREEVDFIHHSENLKILEYSPSQSFSTYTSDQLLLFSHKKTEDLHLSLYYSSPSISTFSSFPLQTFHPITLQLNLCCHFEFVCPDGEEGKRRQSCAREVSNGFDLLWAILSFLLN